MSYILGNITLKNPTGFRRNPIETSVVNTSATGRTTKDIQNRKEQFILAYDDLTQSQVNEILSEYNLEEVRDFSVSETNLTITATAVHIDISPRSYHRGADYREGLILTLTEVS